MISQDDQRRLEEIERYLEATDPRFAARMRRTRPRLPTGKRAIACSTLWAGAIAVTVIGGWTLGILALTLVLVVTILMWPW